jgi:tripartite-type tricarboxylate transporter receptor subunit TctC
VNGKQFLLARRILLAASLAASLGLLFAAPAYPSRPVKIVMPFAPGGPTEFIIRLVADRLTATLGQAFVIENRPGGAGGTVGRSRSPSPNPTATPSCSARPVRW